MKLASSAVLPMTQAKDEPQLDDATFFKEHAREYYYHHNDDFLVRPLPHCLPLKAATKHAEAEHDC